MHGPPPMFESYVCEIARHALSTSVCLGNVVVRTCGSGQVNTTVPCSVALVRGALFKLTERSIKVYSFLNRSHIRNAFLVTFLAT